MSDPTDDRDYDDANELDDEHLPCTWCAGDGTMENDDPLWYGHDRDVSCSACGGTGLRKHQTIF